MQSKFIAKFSFLFLFSLLFTSTMFAGQDKTPPKPFTPEDLMKMDKGKTRPPSGASFQIVATSSRGMYMALLAEESKTVLEYFFHDKLPILEAIVAEAKKFGLTEEAVGGAKPMTTRFSDKQVPNFIVDVTKSGKLTHFYLTLIGQTESGKRGSLTLDAGSIKRGDPEARARFYDILENVRAVKEQAANILQ